MGRLAAGNLTEEVTLTTPGVAVPDGQGGQRPGVNTTATVPAEVKQLSGRELLRLGLTAAVSVIEVRVRYRSDAAYTQRLTWQGRSYNVSQVVQDTRKEFTTFTCQDNGRG